MKEKCIGCGIELQTEYPNKEGYLQEELLKTRDASELYCQRCFKIKNYGKNIPVEFDSEDYRKEVQKTAAEASLALAVFDIIDFEGSFDDEILDILRDMESIVVINKLDLIPDDKHPSEVANWVKNRLGDEGISPLDIAIVSTKNGYGINGIYKKINHFYPKGVNIVVLGVTNVGKSSIINKLIGTKVVTVSKYPGTTLKSNLKNIPKTNINLIDTPGLIPSGRVSDLVCDECNLKVIPSGEISRKTYKLDKDRVIFLGDLVNFRVEEIEESKPIISIYASKNVTFLETNVEKQKEYIAGKRVDILKIPCDKCIDSYKALKMKEVHITANSGEEIAFKGLGWITVKRGPLNIVVNLPESIEPVIRTAFISPKR
ncbi:MAG: ribosome biogenesis GTPase YqeH [Fusobacteriaceae bacterium]